MIHTWLNMGLGDDRLFDGLDNHSAICIPSAGHFVCCACVLAGTSDTHGGGYRSAASAAKEAPGADGRPSGG